MTTNQDVVVAARRRTRAQRVWRSFSTIVGLAMVALLVLLAVFGPMLTPYSYAEVNVVDRFQPPSVEHPFGTDNFGRDIFSRVAHGARFSLLVGFISVGLALVLGIVIGVSATLAGGWIEEATMRLVDILLAFPYIILAIALLAMFGSGLNNVIIVIAITNVPKVIRLCRGQVLSIKELDYVSAARALGVPGWGLLLRHLLPNMVAPLIVFSALTTATAINAEAALSFLGLGLQPPMPSWGGMVADGRRFLFDAPWISGIPGLLISIAVLGFNLMGDSVRDALDPRSQ